MGLSLNNKVDTFDSSNVNKLAVEFDDKALTNALNTAKKEANKGNPENPGDGNPGNPESGTENDNTEKLMNEYKNFSDEALDALYNTIGQKINDLDSYREGLNTEHDDDDEINKIGDEIGDLQTKLYVIGCVLGEKRTAEFLGGNQALENFIGKVYERLDKEFPKRELVVAILNDPTGNGKDWIRRLYPEIDIDQAARLQDNVKPSFTVRCIEARDTTGDQNHVSLYISSKAKLAEDENEKPLITTFNKKDIGLD